MASIAFSNIANSNSSEPTQFVFLSPKLCPAFDDLFDEKFFFLLFFFLVLLISQSTAILDVILITIWKMCRSREWDRGKLVKWMRNERFGWRQIWLCLTSALKHFQNSIKEQNARERKKICRRNEQNRKKSKDKNAIIEVNLCQYKCRRQCVYGSSGTSKKCLSMCDYGHFIIFFISTFLFSLFFLLFSIFFFIPHSSYRSYCCLFLICRSFRMVFGLFQYRYVSKSVICMANHK